MSADVVQTSRSQALWREALGLFPGGVNSPVRAFGAVGGEPIFFERGEGAWLVDVDGRRYVDLVGSWGPLILGHAHPAVVEAAVGAIRRGSSFGAPNADELRLARLVVAAMPAVEQMRFVSSGTEAVMSALRLARAATGRDLVVKFAGGYHGHGDSMLVAAGSGAMMGVATSPGVPRAVAQATTVLPYNDVPQVERLFAERGDAVACVVVEPVAANMGVVLPEPGFLEALRLLCDRHRALLVFDEVVTGFRVAYGGAQARYGIRPDLSTLGKILGGGFPVGAYGGARSLMEKVAPAGPVYQAGTLSGNPVAMAAGAATLEVLRDRDPYPALEERGDRLERGLAQAFRDRGVPARIPRVGSMGTVFFLAEEPRDEASARRADGARFAAFHRAMLARGVYLPPSPFEAWFLSTEHDDAVLDHVLAAAREAAASL